MPQGGEGVRGGLRVPDLLVEPHRWLVYRLVSDRALGAEID